MTRERHAERRCQVREKLEEIEEVTTSHNNTSGKGEAFTIAFYKAELKTAYKLTREILALWESPEGATLYHARCGWCGAYEGTVSPADQCATGEYSGPHQFGVFEVALLESEHDHWTPTAENVNALPEPIRQYVHDLETRCDPAGDLRELAVARDVIRGLESEQGEQEMLRELVVHCWVHSSYKDCGYRKMTDDHRALYDRVIGREHCPKCDAILGTPTESPSETEK